jgi:hypothetical protein
LVHCIQYRHCLAHTNTTKVLTSIKDLIRHFIKIGIQPLEQVLNLGTKKTQNQTTKIVNNVRTNAVNSWGLEISLGVMVPTLVVLMLGCFPDDVGVLSLSLSAGLEGVETFRGKADEDMVMVVTSWPRRINNDKHI